MKKGFWVFIWLCFSFKNDIVSDPTIPPVLTLVSPVRDEPSLTGSFGELRNNHFHGGIDLRASRGPNGDDILAAADGYIKKIIIDADDYGNSLYIQHPNGMVTAYCHLERFRKDIAAVVKARQYQEKRFQTELEFTPEDFPVKAGEHVAFMGNTGASRGKHLHFELRDTNGEEVWDPALFGLSVKDEIAPIIKRVKVYGYDGEGNQVSSQVYGKAQLTKQQLPVGVAGEVFAVALDAQDRSNHSWNWTGIKSIQLYIDGGLFYHFSADKWKRDETKYINAHIDYSAKSAAKGNFHRCHLLSGNKMNVYKTVQNDGFFFMSDSLQHEVRLIVSDTRENQSELKFHIAKKSWNPVQKSCSYADWMYPEQEKDILWEDCKLHYPAGTVYENLNCAYRRTENPSRQAYSDWHGMYPYGHPVHLYTDIRLTPEREIPERLKSKCYVALKRGNGVQSVGGVWEGGELVAKARSLGPFSIQVDTVAPQIRPLVNRKKQFPKGQICFRLTDNLPTTKDQPDLLCEGTIDGQWVLMRYDKKSHTVRHYFEEWLGKGKHHYEITARDYLGNERRIQGSFIHY